LAHTHTHTLVRTPNSYTYVRPCGINESSTHGEREKVQKMWASLILDRLINA